jgi:hypothetical protein
MREPRSIASDLKVWTFIGGPASGYGIEQEDRIQVIGNKFDGVVVE